MAHSETVIDGVVYPSVTQVLSIVEKSFLARWRGKYGNKRCDQKTRAATNIGSEWHSAVQNLVHGVPPAPGVRKRVIDMLVPIQAWQGNTGFVPEVTEVKVVSRIYGYSGTFDAVGKLLLQYADELVMLDWKSSSGIYKDMALQLAAYAQAYFEETGIRITRGLIVLVSKDKPDHKLTVKEYDLTDGSYLKMFANRLSVYKDEHPPKCAKLPKTRVVRGADKAKRKVPVDQVAGISKPKGD